VTSLGNSVPTTEKPIGRHSYHRKVAFEISKREETTVTSLNNSAIQEILDAAPSGDYGPSFESFAENIVVENGPGAGPGRRAEGRDEFANLLLEFAALFNGTFQQHGRCDYVDDRVVINLIEENGTSASGDTIENLAVYVSRLGADEKSDRLWTVDLDTEACLDFWARNPVG
jgi:hypothetical protein